VLPHGPQPPAVHGGLHAARKRQLARHPEVALLVEAGGVVAGVEVRQRDLGVGLEAGLAQLAALHRLLEAGPRAASVLADPSVILAHATEGSVITDPVVGPIMGRIGSASISFGSVLFRTSSTVTPGASSSSSRPSGVTS